MCSHLQGRVVDEHGVDVPRGSEGELCIAGPNVMQGYWALPEQTARSFFVSADGSAWYRTGDIVTEDAAGCYTYKGRRDRMVKRRGYRVELGEIEAGTLSASQRQGSGGRGVLPTSRRASSITAFLSSRDEKPPSLIAIKRFCSENLPLYMIPDKFQWFESLPKTSTDKIDYQRLKEMR